MKYLEYNEKKQHGSVAFPIQYYFVDSTHPEYIMPLHWHKEFEIIHIISGSFELYIDNVKYCMTNGDIAMVPCSVLHRGDPTDCIYECMVFDINMLRKHHNDIMSQYLLPLYNHTVSLKCFYKKENDSEFYNLITSLFSSLKSPGEFYEFRVYSLLFQLFGYIYSNSLIAKNEKTKRNNKQLKSLMNLIDWVEANYTEQITLADLADISGMNEKYLCKFFKEFTGRTPIDYINNLKIQCACHELTVNHLSITDAAFESGFNDLSYFSKTFKRYTGITAKEYKNSIE